MTADVRYAPPEADLTLPPTAAEELRAAHLAHEATIQSLGTLYFLIGAILALPLTLVVMGALLGGEPLPTPQLAAMAPVALVFLWLGFGLRRLRRSARNPAVLISAVGLLAFPIGTLINGYALWMLLCQKGRRVFTDEYRDAIEATPGMRYRTSPVAWAALVLLIGAGVALFWALLR